MEQFSVYEVLCLCGEKVRTLGKTATCGKCGREIVLEAWQVQRTQLPNGIVIQTKDKDKLAAAERAAVKDEVRSDGRRG